MFFGPVLSAAEQPSTWIEITGQDVLLAAMRIADEHVRRPRSIRPFDGRVRLGSHDLAKVLIVAVRGAAHVARRDDARQALHVHGDEDLEPARLLGVAQSKWRPRP
jgi:hypothetical protein